MFLHALCTSFDIVDQRPEGRQTETREVHGKKDEGEGVDSARRGRIMGYVMKTRPQIKVDTHTPSPIHRAKGRGKPRDMEL
jgi:hypothetical protein